MKSSVNFNLNIKPDTVLFFDMDGTLIDTNFANFLSYQEAIRSVIQDEIQYFPSERFNRSNLSTLKTGLSEEIKLEIIRLKEANYKKYLNYTELNKMVFNILNNYSRTNMTVLVTNCREDRAKLLLEYHGIVDKFNYVFFKLIDENGSRINKYENALNRLNLSAIDVVVFENEKVEIEDAIHAGISIENIIKI